MFSEVAEIALVAARLGQFQQLLKTRVILILNFTRPHAITYTSNLYFSSSSECSPEKKISTTVTRQQRWWLIAKVLFQNNFHELLEDRKRYIISCKPVRPECKVRYFGWPLLTSSKSYKRFGKFLVSQFFSQQFSSLGKQV